MRPRLTRARLKLKSLPERTDAPSHRNGHADTTDMHIELDDIDMPTQTHSNAQTNRHTDTGTYEMREPSKPMGKDGHSC